MANPRRANALMKLLRGCRLPAPACGLGGTASEVEILPYRPSLHEAREHTLAPNSPSCAPEDPYRTADRLSDSDGNCSILKKRRERWVIQGVHAIWGVVVQGEPRPHLVYEQVSNWVFEISKPVLELTNLVLRELRLTSTECSLAPWPPRPSATIT